MYSVQGLAACRVWPLMARVAYNAIIGLRVSRVQSSGVSCLGPAGFQDFDASRGRLKLSLVCDSLPDALCVATTRPQAYRSKMTCRDKALHLKENTNTNRHGHKSHTPLPQPRKCNISYRPNLRSSYTEPTAGNLHSLSVLWKRFVCLS